MRLKLIDLLPMKWKVLLDKKYVVRSGTQEIITINMSSDENTMYELLAGSSLTININQTVDSPIVNHSLHILAHDDAICTIVCFIENVITHLHVKFDLVGIRSKGFLTGIIKTGSSQIHTIKTEQIHKGVATESKVKLRGTVEKFGQHTFEGLIRLEAGSRGAVAHQEHKVLMLDSLAVVKSVPCLQVLHKDVVCGHGTALSYIQQQDLYALALRGIQEPQARLLLIQAFLVSE